MLLLAQGTRITLPSGRTGEVITPPGNPQMPCHALIVLDKPVAGRPGCQWFLGEICKPSAVSDQY
ncbi:MAG: hypothetical protein F6J95_007580 [Leptolyngbya sp. SIO1E4]|nr:hypothetical protein [Leptolyngbya sp. SIO1E4]